MADMYIGSVETAGGFTKPSMRGEQWCPAILEGRAENVLEVKIILSRHTERHVQKVCAGECTGLRPFIY